NSALESDKQILEDEIGDLHEKNKQLQAKIAQLQDEIDGTPSSRGGSTRGASARGASVR
nr:myosin II H phosphorylation site [Acanthamoeba sp.]